MIVSGMSLREIESDSNMPTKTTMLAWAANKDHPFSDQYTRAKEVQAMSLAEDLLDIADDGSNDWMERTGKNGEDLGWIVNGECVARSRIRLDTRKWMLSKMLPKIYGDKQTIDHQGGMPIKVTVTYDEPTK